MRYRSVVIMSVALLASPCDARDKAQISWGKPHVGLEQYKSDAVECAKRGYYRDIARDEPARQFLRGFRTADDAMNLADAGGANIDKWNDTVRRTRPDQKLKELQNIQVNDVETCLTEKGYAPFRLSKAEASALRRYPAARSHPGNGNRRPEAGGHSGFERYGRDAAVVMQTEIPAGRHGEHHHVSLRGSLDPPPVGRAGDQKRKRAPMP